MKQILWLLMPLLLLQPSCSKEKTRQIDSSYKPEIKVSDFSNSTQISNPYFPAPIGKTHVYEGQTQDGLERVEERRLTTTKTIMGITCIIINFRAYLNGNLIEEAWDWYGQDNSGNVWYFGEAVDNYHINGTLQDHAGSWEAGMDGAQPGIIMPANPTVGFAYREEYYFNHAEDEAEITATGLTITIPLGTYSNCIKTRNWTDLEPDLNEYKYYAPGVGLIKEENVTDKTEIVLKAIQ